MSFELQGKLIEKWDTVQVNDRFKKREFVIETEENNKGMVFNETIKFQLVQDRCNLLDPIELNSDIKVSFNIKGNKWERDGKVNYFTNLDAWKIEQVAQSNAPDPSNDVPPPGLDDLPPEAPEDDLPF